MVPFEFASVLLLSVAMIGTVSKKEKQRNKMNNILNEIGIRKLFPFYDTFFCIGSLAYYTGEMQLSYVCRNYAERSQSFFVCCIFYLSPRCTRTNFVFSLWLLLLPKLP
jgi:hypothetical protein